ncbi:MAG: PD40 domain-containing protein [Candidatus Dormibacteraeota bacterium]|nr:PD40 domain-containing protein [Candidatus Dormibacteraeota bacterium]
MLGVGGLRVVAGALVGALALLTLVACDDISMPGACGQGGPINSHARPALIFACSAVSVDGGPQYRLWRLLPHGAQQLSREPARDPAVALRTSRLAYDSTAAGAPNVYVSGLNLASPHEVAPAPGGQTQPAWSPDGGRLAYVSGQLGLHAPVGVSGTFGTVFVSTADGGGAHAITPDDSFAGEPAWSPDGTGIAYATDRGGYWNIDTVRPDGGGERMLTDRGQAQWPTWSPDSSRIAYQWSAALGGDPSIWVMDAADGGTAHRLTSGSDPSWSPNGKWIAFVRKTDQGSDLWMISPRGGHAVRITDDAGLKGRPSWV